MKNFYEQMDTEGVRNESARGRSYVLIGKFCLVASLFGVALCNVNRHSENVKRENAEFLRVKAPVFPEYVPDRNGDGKEDLDVELRDGSIVPMDSRKQIHGFKPVGRNWMKGVPEDAYVLGDQNEDGLGDLSVWQGERNTLLYGDGAGKFGEEDLNIQ